MVATGFLSYYQSGPIPYVRCHINNFIFLNVSLIKSFPFFLRCLAIKSVTVVCQNPFSVSLLSLYINAFVDVGNILIIKTPYNPLMGIDLRPTAHEADVDTTGLQMKRRAIVVLFQSLTLSVKAISYIPWRATTSTNQTVADLRVS